MTVIKQRGSPARHILNGDAMVKGNVSYSFMHPEFILCARLWNTAMDRIPLVFLHHRSSFMELSIKYEICTYNPLPMSVRVSFEACKSSQETL